MTLSAPPAPAESPELLTPDEAARWFRRSTSWLRQQRCLLRFRSERAQPLYHLNVCRAYVLGRLAGLTDEPLRRMQLEALAAECHVALASSDDSPAQHRTTPTPDDAA